MLKNLKKLSCSAAAVLLILVLFGGFTFARTVRKELVQIMNFNGNTLTAAKNAVVSFSSDFEQLIPHERRMNTLIYYATGIFNSNHVIWGKDDWLFYSSTNSGDPIADYEGTNRFSIEEMEKIKINMLNQQEILRNMGIEFCLLIPPNKENVYSQYMPDKYIHTDKTRTDILLEYLYAGGINCINPKESLINCDEKYRTFYKLDTHWNELGAYIGTKEALETFGIMLPDLSDDEIETGTSTVSDLADMVGLTSVFPIDYGFKMTFTNTSGEITADEDGYVTHYHNDNAYVEGCIFLIGDSFRSAMIPVLRAAFQDFYVVHRSNYQADMLYNIHPDYVILEIVERHSEQLLDYTVH